MSSPKHMIDLDESVICLDSSNDNTIDIEDTNISVSEIIHSNQTLQPGVAPDGFILIDEDMEPSPTADSSIEKVQKDKDEKPMITVIFRDEVVSRLYKKRVREFLHRLVPTESRNEDSDSDNLVLDVWGKKMGRKKPYDHLDNEKTDKHSDTEDDDVNSLFRIEKRPRLQDRLDVPTYGKKFEQIMDSTSGTLKPIEDEKKSCRPTVSCWNCLGNHSIRNCTEPHNHMMINKNRNEFVSRSSASKSTRYHLENEKYNNFVPGQISHDLKRALGVRDNELPNHIIRMRMLGYPPGWLKEARLQHSGMNLYDSDGTVERDPMEEPGQVVEVGDMDIYDARKIQEFPGFNVPSTPGTRENDKGYWGSKQYVANSKESLVAMINMKKATCTYKRKRLKRNAEPTSDASERIVSEMDVEIITDDNLVENVSANGLFIPPLPKSPPRPPLPPDLEDSVVDSPQAASLDLESAVSPLYVDCPTLADLERRKKQLLEELDDSSVPSPPTTPVTSRSSSSPSHVTCVEQQEFSTANNDEKGQIANTTSSITTPSRGTIKSVTLGTPLLVSTSPYNKLPSVENFSKNICDVINYENLPDSTGKYDQMTGILQKVRDTLASIQQE